MKLLVLLAIFALGSVVAGNAFSADNMVKEQLCKEYAEAEEIPQEEMADYLKECMSNLSDEEIQEYLGTESDAKSES
jgi:hypothetical protein